METRLTKNITILGNSNVKKTGLMEYFNNEMSHNNFTDDDINFSIFEYRKISINGDENYLINSPENVDFKTMDHSFFEDLDGVIVFTQTSVNLDDTDHEILERIAAENIPHILMVNREDFGVELNFSVEGVLTVPIILEENIGVDSAVKMLLKLIEKDETKNDNEKVNEKIKKEEFKSVDEYDPLNLENTSNSEKLNPKGSKFFKLRLFFHPIELENVKKSLAQFGFSNLTIIDIKYQDPTLDKIETYRCSSYEMRLPVKIELMMIVKKEDIEYVIKALEAVKTEDISEKIFISPVEEVIRIRTTERGENAID